MDNNLIVSAAKKLEVLDIVLHESILSRNKTISPASFPALGEYSQQSLLNVSAEEISYVDGKNKTRIFRAYIELGVRAVEKVLENEVLEEPKVFFFIEATYRVDYLLKKTLKAEEAEAFVQYNTVHNVWPFWRQYVFNTVGLAELPKIEIPLFRGIRQISKKEAKKRPTKKATKKN